ncbi:preprotein translocase subunit SecE [Rodentibacter trehalosifermentans]|uniref:Protein translocase subunit SecE n=1 Tax=Rodentibacter trehalosifermentans TaxID=1908263 RepID=A0A1V3J0S8_9PAST|nr:preprotein translocase subunit SecE [Rodentibacter trehalosifermentans]OOF46193.1 preprotein translocase subunit SecE [Rodentibacter trehalosifermentans]OOF48516.1 preprotein translocase subunit SecE [Rodentibacter trehalosifermentans]OOF53916.1 preprotein translocase subunit SecE [Rodentibacter trehalosifermentans]
MATEIVDKKKKTEEPLEDKSKGLNSLLWILVVVFFAAAAIGNIYFQKMYSAPVRVIGMAIMLVLAFVFAAITNQGTKARNFFKEAKNEARKVVWPTRSETRQTTLIVMGVTVVASLFFWATDSIVVSIINFLTDLRF